MIKFFKWKPVRLVCLMFTGILFLNMSFFLAEAAALELNKNKETAEQITKLWRGVAEEEKDVNNGAEKGADDLKEMDFVFHTGITHSSDKTFVALLTYLNEQDRKPDSGITSRFNPPPEVQ